VVGVTQLIGYGEQASFAGVTVPRREKIYPRHCGGDFTLSKGYVIIVVDVGRVEHIPLEAQGIPPHTNEKAQVIEPEEWADGKRVVVYLDDLEQLTIDIDGIAPFEGVVKAGTATDCDLGCIGFGHV
jgi:hypothetical protein